MMKVLLLCLAISVIVATKEVYVIEGRQIQVTINHCEDCNCEYYSFNAFEQDSKTKTDVHTHTSNLAFYYNHQKYDTCASTYTSEYMSLSTASVGFKISASGKTAHMNMTGLVDNLGNTINFDFSLYDIDSTSNCKCRYSEQIGVNSYSQQTDSNYIRTGVTGSLTRNSEVQLLTGATGYIYSYGTKTIIINS